MMIVGLEDFEILISAGINRPACPRVGTGIIVLVQVNLPVVFSAWEIS